MLHLKKNHCVLFNSEVLEGLYCFVCGVKVILLLIRRHRQKMWAATGWPEGKERLWLLKEEALDHTLWRPGFGRCYGPVIWQTTEQW